METCVDYADQKAFDSIGNNCDVEGCTNSFKHQVVIDDRETKYVCEKHYQAIKKVLQKIQ